MYLKREKFPSKLSGGEQQRVSIARAVAKNPATLFMVWRALRLRPVELMKGQPQKKKSRFQLRKLPLGKLSFSGKFRLRELTRNFSKTLLMMFGVLMASVFLQFGFVSQSSIDYVLNEGYTDTYKYQYNTTFNTLQPDAKLIAMKTADGDKLAFDKNIITKPLADSLGVQAGDTVHATSKLTDKQYSVKIDAIAETYTGNNIYLPLAKFNELIGLLFPLEYDLLQKAMVVAHREGFEELAGIFGKWTEEWIGNIFEDMDLTKFRPGTDIQKAIEIISWTLDTFGQKYAAEHTDAEDRLVMDGDALIRGMDEYVALLKTGLYAQPGFFLWTTPLF